MRHLVTPPTILFYFMPSLLGCSEDKASFVPSNGVAGHATCGPSRVCIAASCKELCSDEHGCSLNDICIGGLCEDGALWRWREGPVEEECDLGADNANDGLCLLDCTLNQCGDGFVYVGHEECDDGNLIDGDSYDLLRENHTSNHRRFDSRS